MEEVNMNYKELYQPAHTIIGCLLYTSDAADEL